MQNIFKKLAVAGLATLAVSTLGIKTAQASNIVSVVGDQDCFGTNRTPCNTASINEAIANREPDDGGFDNWGFAVFNWTHNYILPANETITSAVLTIATLDLEDGGAGDGLGGAPYDTRLFVDGIEVPGAFDTTFTPDGGVATQLPVNTTVFNLTPNFFSSLLDGTATIGINSTGGQRGDFVSVDYAKLEIHTAPVPEPGAALGLLALTAVGAGVKLKKKIA
jgi:hypothetical protein